jgi:hypothetical protein
MIYDALAIMSAGLSLPIVSFASSPRSGHDPHHDCEITDFALF